MPRLILASKSPRRKKLLEMLGLQFDIHPANIRERLVSTLRPADLVQELSLRKAIKISDSKPEDCIILAADTIVVLQDKILGQPTDKQEAKQMLHNLSENTHEVLTGVTLLKTDQNGKRINKKQFYERTKVTFGTLTDQDIDMYVNSGNPLDKAGAYGIQDDWGAVFVSRITGDYYNVVGLPVHKLYLHLKQFAPEILPNSQLQDARTN